MTSRKGEKVVFVGGRYKCMKLKGVKKSRFVWRHLRMIPIFNRIIGIQQFQKTNIVKYNSFAKDKLDRICNFGHFWIRNIRTFTNEKECGLLQRVGGKF